MASKILVVDDSEGVQKLIKRALAPDQYHILNAYDGVKAMQLVQRENPDLILLDINMPGKDGREVIKELRRDIKTRMIPVIMVTGDAGALDKIQGLELGADDYITKPFDIMELTARVKNMLERNSRFLAANPLTLLPGGPSIEEEVNRRIRDKEPFAFFYIDIDHFKAFNDSYGYANGDKVIQETAEILVQAMKTAGNPQNFAGHIGGDDYVAVTSPQTADSTAREIARRFDGMAQSFYTQEDQHRGYIVTTNRKGAEQRFPLMTLSIAITVSSEKHLLEHYAIAVETVTEIKLYLKSLKGRRGSVFMKDRRNGAEYTGDRDNW